jgi:drug/metabolite transporter (DMT)-like permease
VLLSNIAFFLGLAALPLADGVALFFVAPLLITALSVPLLGERWARAAGPPWGRGSWASSS